MITLKMYIKYWKMVVTKRLSLLKYNLFYNIHVNSHDFEKQLLPHIKHSEYLLLFGWGFCLLSLVFDYWVIAEYEMFQRSGAVLVASALLIDLKTSRAKSIIHSFGTSYYSGNDVNRLVVDTSEKIGELSVRGWLYNQERHLIGSMSNNYLMIFAGTLIWAYGDLIRNHLH